MADRARQMILYAKIQKAAPLVDKKNRCAKHVFAHIESVYAQSQQMDALAVPGLSPADD